MTNAAFAFMLVGVLALVGVCVVSTGMWPLVATAASVGLAFLVYAKDW